MSKEISEKIIENIYSEEFSSLKKDALQEISLSALSISENFKTNSAKNLLEKKEKMNLEQKAHIQTYDKTRSNNVAIKDYHGAKKNVLQPSLMKKQKTKEFKRTKR